MCHGSKTFVKTFKHLFNTLNPLLFSETDIFRFSIDNEVEANAKLDSYHLTLRDWEDRPRKAAGEDMDKSVAFEFKEKDDIFEHLAR